MPVTPEHRFYRVHLEALESGFTNTFSPDYEIRSVPDMAPTVEITAPERNREVSLSEIVRVTGLVRDDFGLAEILRAWRHGDSDWQEQVLATEFADLSAELVNDWSLTSIPLQPGDSLHLKLVAVDTRGNRGESEVVRLVVRADPENTEKREWAVAQQDLAEQMDSLWETVGEMAKAIGDSQKALKKSSESFTLSDQQRLIRAKADLERAMFQAERVFDAAKALQREAPTLAEAEQMQTVAEAISAMQFLI